MKGAEYANSMKWTRPVDVFLPGLDAEHDRLHSLVRELNAAASKGDAGGVHAILRALLAHVGGHFTHEERMMRTAGYPAYDWHKRQHDTARRKARDLSGRVEGGEAGAVPELMDFFVSWLRDHTAVHDRMMGAYIRNFQRTNSREVS